VGGGVALALGVAEGAAVDVEVGDVVALAVGVFERGALPSLEQAARPAQRSAVASRSRHGCGTVCPPDGSRYRAARRMASESHRGWPCKTMGMITPG
jgi:hypothetical protein